MKRQRFLYRLKTSEYRREWGRTDKKLSAGDCFLAFLLSLLPFGSAQDA